MSTKGKKLTTVVGLAPGASVNKVWNNANADVYHLNAWPVGVAGTNKSAQITRVRYVVHGNPQERELHYTVKNTGQTTADIDVWAFSWWSSERLSLHLKVLTEPTSVDLIDMVTSMRTVYAAAGIVVRLRTREDLNLPSLLDVDVGECTSSTITDDQTELFSNRNDVDTNEVVAYFVRSTIDPLNGCAAHPAGQPSVIVTRVASPWTLGHEVGHVLGLGHVTDSDSLMTGDGTWGITNPPPNLSANEISEMKSSDLTIEQ